jgi:hypothetical protein
LTVKSEPVAAAILASMQRAQSGPYGWIIHKVHCHRIYRVGNAIARRNIAAAL